MSEEDGTSRNAEASSVDDMTPAEREQWLRDRGVQIETANDRLQLEAVMSGNDGNRPPTVVEQIQRLSLGENTNEGIGGSSDGLKFVYLPHDTSKPISEITLPRRLIEALGPAGDMIPTYVKSYFADGRSIDEKLFHDQVSKQNLVGGDIDKFAASAAASKTEDGKSSSTTTSPSSKLTSDALTNATSGGSVETFPLVRPSSTNKHQGVYIYLDEVGLLKNLPLNSRASQLAQRCGYHPAPNFYGDVFVGRVASQSISKGYLHNLDFEKEDVIDTTKEWAVRAPQENVAWQQAVNEVTGKQGELQPSHAGTDGVAVEVKSNDTKDGYSYSWMQNDEEIEVTIPLLKSKKEIEEGVKVKKSMVKVSFQPQKIVVTYDGELVLEQQLYSKVDVDGCTWTLEKGQNLVITCEKARGGEIWPFLLKVG